MNLLNNLDLEEKDGWFTLRGWEGIFHVDLETGRCDCCGKTIKENKFIDIDKIVKHKNYIFLFPITENNILVYDIQNKKNICKIELDEKCYFDNVIVWGEYIYCINNWSENPSIYIIDIKDFYVANIIYLEQSILCDGVDIGRVFSRDIVLEKDVLIIASAVKTYMIKVGLNDHKVEYINISCNLKNFIAICSDGENYWLTDEDGLTVKWNLEVIEEEYDLKEIFDLNLELSEHEMNYKENSYGYRASYMYFNSIIYMQGNIFWIPGRADKIVKYNTSSKQWSTVYLKPQISGATSWLLYPILKDNLLWIFSLREEKLLKIGKDIDEIVFEFKIKNKEIFKQNDIWHEKREATFVIEDYINNSFKIKQLNKINEKNIWDMIKK